MPKINELTLDVLIKENKELKAKVKELGEFESDFDVKVLRALAATYCPVSGYVITSKKSRKQIEDYANFVEACNNE
jgi:hypothetical protein